MAKEKASKYDGLFFENTRASLEIIIERIFNDGATAGSYQDSAQDPPADASSCSPKAGNKPT
jgi:hypothetical protein